MKVPATATESAVGSRNSNRTGIGLGTVDELSRVLDVEDNKERVACFMAGQGQQGSTHPMGHGSLRRH